MNLFRTDHHPKALPDGRGEVLIDWPRHKRPLGRGAVKLMSPLTLTPSANTKVLVNKLLSFLFVLNVLNQRVQLLLVSH